MAEILVGHMLLSLFVHQISIHLPGYNNNKKKEKQHNHVRTKDSTKINDNILDE